MWQVVGNGRSCAHAGISWHGDNVYAACQSTVSSYSADGRRLWQTRLEHTSGLQPPVVDESGTVYVAATFSPGNLTQYGVLTAISDVGGKMRWTVVLERPLTVRPLIGPDGVLYLGGNNRLYAVSSAGQLLWEHRLHLRDNCYNPVVRLVAHAGGIVASADRTVLRPVCMRTQ